MYILNDTVVCFPVIALKHSTLGFWYNVAIFVGSFVFLSASKILYVSKALYVAI